jgi:Cu(I)/Ag(I) efflux system membrane protein CusA/SilA
LDPFLFGLASCISVGDILYMPTAVPGMSVTEATPTLQIQDRMIRKLTEVQSVFGKAGQAESSTDPAPLSMFEKITEVIIALNI